MHAVAEENVSATRIIAAPVARVFAVLADPAAHAAIDGTRRSARTISVTRWHHLAGLA